MSCGQLLGPDLVGLQHFLLEQAGIAARAIGWRRRRLPRLAALGEFLGVDQQLELARRNVEADAIARLDQRQRTADREIELNAKGLPSTFVPGRNLAFFIYAAALADRRGLQRLVGGMCETDFSGYPDCRNDTLQSLVKSISLGMDAAFAIATPLMWIDKAGTFALAQALGGERLLELLVEDTHTCYLGDRSHRHEWGYGCGTCPACRLRGDGFAQWKTQRKAAP